MHRAVDGRVRDGDVRLAMVSNEAAVDSTSPKVVDEPSFLHEIDVVAPRLPLPLPPWVPCVVDQDYMDDVARCVVVAKRNTVVGDAAASEKNIVVVT